MSSRTFIHATSVHQGGGRSLLDALLRALPEKEQTMLSLDERMPIPEGAVCNAFVRRVKPSFIQRLNAEVWLARSVAPEDIVLCFGSLPPLFRLRGRAIVFVQNRYLIDEVKLNGFPLKIRLRLAVERLWLSRRISNATEFIVQTQTMKSLLETKTQGKVPVRALPFVAESHGYMRSVQKREAKQVNDFDFVYVASGEPHKNHRRLIEAWCLLAEEGVFPSLCLTLEEARFPDLCRDIEMMRKRHGLAVKNAGELSYQEVLELYKKAGAVVYPSTLESFGLPLIEASRAGLPVLAPELDYVRDVLDPSQTFDPESAMSIARAVKRYMGMNESPLPLLDAAHFMALVLKNAE